MVEFPGAEFCGCLRTYGFGLGNMAQVYLKRTSETLGMRTCNEIILLLILLIHRTRRRKAMILQVQDMFCCPVITENK